MYLKEPSQKTGIRPKTGAYRMAKRLFDVVFSAVVLVVLCIPCILIALLIYLETKAAPFYREERVGQFGRLFKIIKFRTMVADSNDLEKYLTPEQIAQMKRERKIPNDPRVTRIGKLLRKYSIDEIPQFANVLLGEMSVVGPRAITAGELHWFGDRVDELLSVPCGITGLWQVARRNDATFASGERQRLELGYVRQASFMFDLKICFYTIFSIFRTTGF